MVEHRDPDHIHDDAPVHRRTVLESGGSGGAGIVIAIVILLVLAVAFFFLFGDAFQATEGDTVNVNVDTPGLTVPEADAPDLNVDTGEPAAPADSPDTVDTTQ
jgi:hypothetical protein